MPPIRAVIRGVLDEVGGKLQDAGETVADGGKGAVDQVNNTGQAALDTAKDTGEVLGQAKDIIQTYEQLKDKVTSYYQWYLDNKQLIYLILCIIALILIMCLLQCAYQWLRCWAQSCCACWKIGACCIRQAGYCGPVFRRAGTCLIDLDRCMPDGGGARGGLGLGLRAAKEMDEKGDSDSASGDGGQEPSRVDMPRQGIGEWINEHTCWSAPEHWVDPKAKLARLKDRSLRTLAVLERLKIEHQTAAGGPNERAVEKIADLEGKLRQASGVSVREWKKMKKVARAQVAGGR